MNATGPSNDEYETPPWLFKALDTEFGFTFDGAASEANALIPHYATVESELLDWSGERVFVNPPYSNIDLFVRRALYMDGFAVLLLPSRTGTEWFQRLKESPRVELRFLRKRIRFYLNGKEEASPRFDSIIAIVRPRA